MLHARFISGNEVINNDNDDSHFVCHLVEKDSGSDSVEGEKT